LEALVKAAQSQPALLRFVEEIAGFKHEGEPDDNGQPSETSLEDAIDTLNQLIFDARKLLGLAEECRVCGKIVPYVMVRRDGTKMCRDCFDANQQ
jgi:hypothetical protein